MRLLLSVLLVLGLTACATDNVADSSPQRQAARAKIYTELGAEYYSRAQYKIALEEVSKALAADSRYAPAYNVRGLVHMALQEDSEAESDFSRSLNIDPGNSEVRNNYGWFLCQHGRERESVKHFLLAAKDPLYATPEKAYLNAGVCSKKAGERQDAEMYFRRALIYQPNMAEALAGLAEVAFMNGDFPGAKSYFLRFEQASVPTPLTAENLLLAVRIERGLGDARAASNYAARLSKSYPTSREAQVLKQMK